MVTNLHAKRGIGSVIRDQTLLSKNNEIQRAALVQIPVGTDLLNKQINMKLDVDLASSPYRYG